MKKLVYVTIALVAIFSANSCKNKNNVPAVHLIRRPEN